MKKTFITCLLAGVTLMASAEYSHLLFRTTDGTQSALAADGIVITFVDGTMHAVSGTETLDIPVTSLTDMYFGNPSVVNLSEIEANPGTVTVFSPSGTVVGHFATDTEARTSLPKGIYIIKNADGKTSKTAVTK